MVLTEALTQVCFEFYTIKAIFVLRCSPYGAVAYGRQKLVVALLL